jgi:hypothetical protein
MTKEEKVNKLRHVVADVQAEATNLGLTAPFISFAMDAKGGVFMLDAPPVSDTLALPQFSWDSDQVFVVVFSVTRRLPLPRLVKF